MPPSPRSANGREGPGWSFRPSRYSPTIGAGLVDLRPARAMGTEPAARHDPVDLHPPVTGSKPAPLRPPVTGSNRPTRSKANSSRTEPPPRQDGAPSETRPLPVPGRRARPSTIAPAPAAISVSCPYCARLLEPPPASSRACPRCRMRIVVKHLDGRAVYLAADVVPVFESERRRAASSPGAGSGSDSAGSSLRRRPGRRANAQSGWRPRRRPWKSWKPRERST